AMKKIPAFFVLFFSITILASCTKTEVYRSGQEEITSNQFNMSLIIGKVNSRGDASLIINHACAQQAFKRYFESEYGGTFTISDVVIKGTSSYYYLCAYANDADGRSRTIALLLLLDGVDLRPMEVEGEKHLCSGSNCQACDFVSNADGKIIGCDCLANGFCNHTKVSSWDTGDLVNDLAGC
nr:hypothetical protein [Bacteroidota bacterium]